jgi:hypothetical protein
MVGRNPKAPPISPTGRLRKAGGDASVTGPDVDLSGSVSRAVGQRLETGSGFVRGQDARGQFRRGARGWTLGSSTLASLSHHGSRKYQKYLGRSVRREVHGDAPVLLVHVAGGEFHLAVIARGRTRRHVEDA